MNRIKLLLTVSLTACLLALYAAEADGIYVWKQGICTRFDLGEMLFRDGKISIAGATVSVDEVDSITFVKPAVMPAMESDTLFVSYLGDEATVTPAGVAGITATIEGAAVNIVNTNTDREMCFVLSGRSEAGSFTYDGDYKATIRLSGLSLKSTTGAALHVKCGKRTALELQEGTVNTLEDATDDLGQKAALYCKGHLEVSGSGSLSVKGNVRHGINTKEYLLVKKTTGSITVNGAAGDGIHVGQYFQMNGGSVTIGGTKGDGIQAEANLDGEERDGQLILKGGVLDVELTARDAAALKSDSLMTIDGGNVTIHTSGDGDKGLKSKTDIQVSGGEMTFTQSSKCVVDDGSDDKDDGNAPQVSPYRICVALSSTTSSYWKGLYLCSSDGTRLATLSKTITVAASGQTTRTFYTYEFDAPTGGQYYLTSDDYRSGGSRPGQQGSTYKIRSTAFNGPSASQPAVYYLLNVSNYTTSGTTRSFSVTDYTSRYSGGTITATGTATPAGAVDYITAAAIKADRDITISGGTITITNTGQAAKSITCDRTLTTTGGIVSITNSGAGLGSGSGITTAKGMTADTSVALLGGEITIRMSGTGGKGVKSDGKLVIGRSDSEGPALTVSTTGGKYASSSSSKAIKAENTITVNGGTMNVTTSTDGAEGMESKLKSAASIVINGGRHYFKCYDDCINTAGCILFDGGVTVCYATNNDAVDSNYGASGAICIGDGTVLAYTSKGSPEEGLDCDNNSYIKITGKGLAISAGGSQGGGGGGFGGGGSTGTGSIGSAVQGYCLSTTSISYQSGRYYTLADASGHNLVTYSFPVGFSSPLNLITAPGMTKGSQYTIKYSTTRPTDATLEWNGLYIGSSATGTTSVLSFTAQ